MKKNKIQIRQFLAKPILFALTVLLAFTFVWNAPLIRTSKAEQAAGKNYYYADFDNRGDAIQAGHDLNEEIMEEGITLLKNEGNALPLTGKKNISVFGKNSIDISYGGAGSGSGSSAGRVNLQTGLANAGFNLNPTLMGLYSSFGTSRKAIPGYTIVSGHPTYEMPVSSYTETVKDSYAAYSDAALVVITRTGGESSDLPRTMGTGFNADGSITGTVSGARSNTDHYLQLDQNETDLIAHVCAGDTFDTVIVVLNTGSQFETGFLDDPGHYAYNAKIKGALWIGFPGAKGLNALGKILNGTKNPSGKTVDTYARDFKTDPTWANFSNNLFTDGHQYTNNVGSGNANKFISYEEGIYSGYRYWETRGFTEGADAYTTDGTAAKQDITGTTTKTWDNWYDAHVVYPMGYGLSYTSFSQTIVSSNHESGATLSGADTITVNVEVQNTGETAGKDIIQLYYTAPYTAGGIEKPYVVLGAFEKTSLLQPGEKEIKTLTLKVRDMASYDFSDANNNQFKGYELDAGNYEIKIMRDGHTKISALSFTLPAVKYETEENGTKIENLFDGSDKGIRKYLSRADFHGTFPQIRTVKEAMPDGVADKVKEWLNQTNVADKTTDPWYTDEMPTTGAKNGIVLSDLIGLDFEDPKWELFMDQFVVGNKDNGSGMLRLVSYGGWIMESISELGIPNAFNGDGPSGWANGHGVATDQVSYCSDTVLASTYSKELAYRKGILIGNEGLFGGGKLDSSYPTGYPNPSQTAPRYAGWYAPAVNIHRSPFSGRNFEYFSEDAFLTGILAAEIVKGAQEKGVFCFVKHFGVNDQESNRDGLITWASEQSMREIYLKSFEITVKEGKTRAMMSALNRVGEVWTGGSYNLMTRLLRDEWGFRGTVVTDYCNGRGAFMNLNQMIRTGGDLALSHGGNWVTFDTASATSVAALRRASKNICYTLANSLGMNGLSPAIGDGFQFQAKRLRTGMQGVSYTDDLSTGVSVTFEGDDYTVFYALKEGSTLPDGLTLSKEGMLTGTPQSEAMNHRFSVIATYSNAEFNFTSVREAVFALNISGASGSILYDKDGKTIDTAFVGKAYSANIGGATILKTDDNANEPDPEILYSMKPGSLLPEGLSLSEDGIVSGTAVKICSGYVFTVIAEADGFAQVEATMTVSVFYESTYAGKTLSSGKFGAAYFESVATAENTGSAAIVYSLKEGSTLPAGLILTKDGYISGTPGATVTNYRFTVVAKAGFTTESEAEFQMSIGVGFTAFTLQDGKKDSAYEASLDMARGSGDVTYSLKAGSVLPEGLSLSAGGDLSGTPTTAGVYTFTVVAESEGCESDEIQLRLFVAGSNKDGGGCESSISGLGGTGAALILTVGLCLILFTKKKNFNS